MGDLFHKIATRVSGAMGSPFAFLFAIVLIVAWALAGPAFGFSNTWQLVINTVTTVVTFLMVFLIQNTQNRDSRVVHLKLDELIKALQGARDDLIDLEELTDKELNDLHDQFRKWREKKQAGVLSKAEDEKHRAEITGRLHSLVFRKK